MKTTKIRKMKTIIETVVHPMAPELKVDVIFENGHFMYDENGDFYNEEWPNRLNVTPLEACVEDAKEYLDDLWSGAYYEADCMGQSEARAFDGLSTHFERFSD